MRESIDLVKLKSGDVVKFSDGEGDETVGTVFLDYRGRDLQVLWWSMFDGGVGLRPKGDLESLCEAWPYMEVLGNIEQNFVDFYKELRE